MPRFRVLVKTHHRQDLAAAHPHPNFFSITLIQPLSFLTFTHSSAQRTTPIYFAFNHLHTLSIVTEGVGGTPPARRASVPTFKCFTIHFFIMHLRVAILQALSFHTIAHSFVLFCTHKKTQPPCFQSFPHSASKNRGGGCPVSSAQPFRGDCHAPNQSPVTSLAIRPIAAKRAWCHNWQQR